MLPLFIGAAGVNLVVFVTGCFLLYAGVRAWRFTHVISNTVTASPGSVAAGRAEVEGRVEADGEPIEAPFTGEACACLDWTLEQYTDGEWVERAAETQIDPFYLAGESGSVLVRADKHRDIEALPWQYDSVNFTGAETADAERCLRERDVGGSNPATTSQPAATTGPEDSPEDSRWRFIKRLIVPGQRLYVFGSLEPQDERGEIGFETEPTTGRFVISPYNEQWTGSEYRWLGLLAFSAGILLVLWGGSFVLGLLSELFLFVG